MTSSPRPRLSSRLPDFPWDTIADAKARAQSHPDGIVDLSVGTPVDPTPQVVQDALAHATDAHGYPTVWGPASLRQAIIEHLHDRWNTPVLPEQGVLPVIGTKWLVAWLPTLLGLTSSDTVVIPTTAYPTYRVGAELIGATVVECDDPAELGDLRPGLVWINSPANPHGAILSREQVQGWVTYAREVGAVLASDECYGEFAWDAEPTSVLDADICGGDPTGLLVAHSLSKQSNMAGYRAGFVAGDPEIVTELLGLGKHTGMMLAAPILAAMEVALRNRGHVDEQRERYRARRAVMREALERAGFTLDHSEGSIYLWATRGEDCRASVDWLADRGILVAPGDFYGEAGRLHVRVGLTASDERIAAAAARLSDA
ncbi:succinyldiaminopimelate transaminase [Aestuariimicrobium ganziense]|uniref:succinyldiaminopimelate transaminase n=1 Tax=Aestuariimicrobium ganziense TaxID=2773677 RepID=UPI002E2E468D|nr:succinyldiaminopimelate transaminase [Aestuariimicrobium ganziense]